MSTDSWELQAGSRECYHRGVWEGAKEHVLLRTDPLSPTFSSLTSWFTDTLPPNALLSLIHLVSKWQSCHVPATVLGSVNSVLAPTALALERTLVFALHSQLLILFHR